MAYPVPENAQSNCFCLILSPKAYPRSAHWVAYVSDNHPGGLLGSNEEDRYVVIKRLPDGRPCQVEPAKRPDQARKRLAEI